MTGPLAGLVVIDMSTMMAGPHSAMLLADFGATVVKVEPPQGDPSRRTGWDVNGTSVWWRLLGRNKLAVTLNLKHPKGRELMLRMLDQADVLIENMRPGKLEQLGLAPAILQERNRGLVILRVTGWGQTGPYADRPSFGTQAEAMSGFAHINGHRDGPPTLPPITLADGAAGYLGAFAVMAALWRRAQDAQRRGQVIDLSLFEALFGMLGPMASAHEQLGVVMERNGSRTSFFAPRNIYRCRDGRYVAVSAAAEQIVPRVFAAIGRPELAHDPRFRTIADRVEHVDALDAIIEDWTGRHDAAEVVASFTASGAAAAPIYTIADIFADPHVQARAAIAGVDTHDIGQLQMQNVAPRFSETPGALRWAGRALGADTEAWLMERLGLSREDVAALRRDGAI
jgi:formyl-CoA transferase